MIPGVYSWLLVIIWLLFYKHVKLTQLSLPQPKSLTEMSGYSLEDLMPCVEDLHQTYIAAAQHAQQSVQEKYKTPKWVNYELGIICIVWIFCIV